MSSCRPCDRGHIFTVHKNILCSLIIQIEEIMVQKRTKRSRRSHRSDLLEQAGISADKKKAPAKPAHEGGEDARLTDSILAEINDDSYLADLIKKQR